MNTNSTTEIKEDLENTQDNLNKIARDLGKQTKLFIQNKQGEFEELATAYCDHVKAHPVRSVLIGFAVGILFNKMFTKIST